MSSLVLPCLGLAPDQHAMGAPKGAMRIADNVVCDLPKIVRGRTSFELHTNKVTTFKPTAMHVWGGTPILVSRDGSTWRIESTAGTYTGEAEPVSYDDRETSFAEARKSLYYCSKTGVRALRAVGDAATDAAGMGFQHLLSPQQNIVGGTSGSFARSTAYFGPFTEPFSVAYVMCVKRTDSNGYVKRSPPTNRFYLRRPAGGAADDVVVMLAGPSTAGTACRFPSGTLIAGDVVEFYRTLTGAAQFSDLASDVYLVSTYTITAADVAAGYFPPSQVELVDRVSDDDLGEELYTNPGREGALAAKYTAPLAQEIAVWAGCMWHGRTKERQRLVLTLVNNGDQSGGGSGAPTAESIGAYSTTGDFATGTNTILNVVSITGLAIGAYVGLNGANPFTTPAAGVLPVGTKVTEIAGAGPYTVTMSANATGNSVGATIYFGDVLTVDGVDFVAWPAFVQTPLTDARRTFFQSQLTTMSTRVDAAATSLARAINDYAAVSGGTVVAQAIPGGIGGIGSVGNTGTLVLERTSPTGAAFVVKSTKPQAWRPAIGNVVTDTLSSTAEDRPNRIFFSLPDEPEAVPLVNYIDVGSQLHPIQRLIPLTDALLVWKTDGLYRITGTYGATGRPGWSVDCIDSDPNSRLVRPEDCSVMEGEAYGWTNRGFVVANETGVRSVVSQGKIDTALALTRAAMLADPTIHGSHVVCHGAQRLVLLSVPVVAGTPARTATDVYAFSVLTGSWTRWPSIWWRCAAYDASKNRVYSAVNNSLDELEWEVRYSLDTSRGYDRRYSSLAMTESATSLTVTITNAQRGEWVPTAGDWVFWKTGSGDYYRRVLTATATGGGDYSFTLDELPPAAFASASDVQAFVGAPVLLEWLPCSMGTTGYSLGVWREFTIQMDQEPSTLAGMTTARFVFGARSDGAVAIPTVPATPDRATLVLTRPYRIGWPRNAARRPVVAPRLSFSELNWPWRLASVALVGEAGSERVRQ